MKVNFDISEKTLALAERAEADCKPVFAKIDETAAYNAAKVLKGFQDAKISTAHFVDVTGYGYTDDGRDKIEELFARVFGAEDALVRPQLMSGTHALYVTLSALLHAGDTLVYVSGEPYDTLRSVIGTSGDSRQSLIRCGVKYEDIPLLGDNFDLAAVRKRFSESFVRVAAIQRSRGYANRRTFTVGKIAEVIALIREVSPKTLIMVDNCYGEFTETKEPSEVGCDVFVGSMMKNLGAGFAVSGAYCVGKKAVIAEIAERLSAPCIGKDLGANFNQLASFYKGFFMAPVTVAATLKSMVFAARLLELAGFSEISPRYDEERSDIVQTVALGTAENLIRFCRGLQRGSPIEAYATPEPSAMPGYPHDEVSAAGTFVTGATNELSCDGPLTPPYTVYMQGGLAYEYGKLGVMRAVDEMLR